MAAEVLYIPATMDDMPAVSSAAEQGRSSDHGADPHHTVVQLLLIVVLFAEDALNFMLDLCTSLALIPYLLSAAYALKLVITKETYAARPAVYSGATGSRACGDLQAVPGVRGRPEVPADVLHHLCSGHRLVRDRPPRECSADVPAIRTGALRADHHWGVIGVVLLATGAIAI